MQRRLRYELVLHMTRSLDWCCGVRTEFCKNPESNHASPDVLKNAKRYQPSSYRLIFRSLRWCNQHFPNRPILDLGCGAGRALVVSALVGFTDIHGLELDEQLSEQARDNLARFQRRFFLRRQVSIITASVTDYLIEKRAWLIYLYNPFGEIILSKFLEKNASVLLNEDCLFVYVNPMHEHCLLSMGYKNVHCWDVTEFSQSTRVYRHEKHC
jgi:hypothetical protein